jgi:IS5 family transposase
MIMCYHNLMNHPAVFVKMTGLRVEEFNKQWADVEAAFVAAEEKRLERRDRQRAIGGGLSTELDGRDQMLMSVIWLRQYPTHDVLGYLFGVSQPVVGRYIGRVLPVLEQAGLDSMRMPDPGKKHRRDWNELLQAIPEMAVIVDSFEQKVQRPKAKQERDSWYSKKKKAHTLKSQVTVDETTGRIVHIGPSVKGRIHDMNLLKQSHMLEQLPDEVGCIGDAAYQGIHRLHPLASSSRKKPRSKPRTEQDIAFNRALSQRRIVVENTIGKIRRFQALAQTDRQHRLEHTARVRAVAGLVNRQIARRFPN